MHRNATANAATAECQNLLDQRAGHALPACMTCVQLIVERLALAQLPLRQLAVAQDRAQDVVEVVRDAAGERADRLHLLRTAQRVLRTRALQLARAQFLLRALTLSDVDHSAHKFNEMAGRAQNRMTYDVNVPDGAIRMHDAVVRLPLCLLADSRLG